MKIEIRREGQLQVAGGPQKLSIFDGMAPLTANFISGKKTIFGYWYVEGQVIHLTNIAHRDSTPLKYDEESFLWNWAKTIKDSPYSLSIDGYIQLVGDISYLFSGLILDKRTNLMNLDVSKVTNMEGLFLGCTIRDGFIDLSGWDTSSVTNMARMFKNCRNLKHIYVTDEWTTKEVKESEDMFRNASRLHKFDEGLLDKAPARIDLGKGIAYLEKHWVDFRTIYYRLSDDGESVSLLGEPTKDFSLFIDSRDFEDAKDIYVLGPITVRDMAILRPYPNIKFHDDERIKIITKKKGV